MPDEARMDPLARLIENIRALDPDKVLLERLDQLEQRR